MKVLCVYDNSGPKYLRILLPVYLMTGVEIISNNKIDETELDGVDIVFCNRMIPGIQIQKLLDLRTKYGFKLIVDFDDHWHLSVDHYLYEHYIAYRIPEIMEVYIKEADAVTVTHERLYDKVFPINDNVHILPNAIPKFGQFLFKKQPDEKVRLFWAGGVTHKKDIEILRNPAKKINCDKVKWVIGGYVKSNPEWLAMTSAFTGGGKFENEILESLPVENYYAMYSKCDIALIPLLPTEFNSFKSNLKILEAANMGCAVVVSKVHPYLDFPDELVNYVKVQGDWYKQVMKLLNSPGMMAYQGQRLKEYCDTNFNFNEINLKRKQIFESVKQGNTREPAECLNG